MMAFERHFCFINWAGGSCISDYSHCLTCNHRNFFCTKRKPHEQLWRRTMWKAALAGALALVAVSVMPASADPVEGQIAQAKASLNLTPQQARHWPRVAAAVRAVARQASQASTASAATHATGARRVLAAAVPLIRTLSPEQRQTALSLVRAMGYGHVASRL
jgi:hypothetical protein